MIVSFPNNKIKKLDEEECYNLMKEVEKIITTNTASIRSEVGRGEHGDLGLIMSTTKHTSTTGTDFTPCTNLGSYPTFPPL